MLLAVFAAAGRYVIVSLQSGVNEHHVHVIFGKDADGEFLAITKSGSQATGAQTVEVKRVKGIITKMKEMDILTCEVGRPPPRKRGDKAGKSGAAGP